MLRADPNRSQRRSSLMNHRHLLLLAVTALLPSGVCAQSSVSSSLYERIEARLKATPAIAERIGTPSPEIRGVAWMLGRWKVSCRVFGRDEEKSIDRGESVSCFVRF
jgi:hypothetical protein